MQLKHYPTGFLALLVLLAAPLEAQAADGKSTRSPTAYLNAEISDGMLTLKARDVTVEQIVKAIAHQSGIRLVLNKPLDERVSPQFDQVPVPQALGRLLRGEDYALQCAQPLCRSTGPGDSVEGTLWVLSDEAGYHRVSVGEDDDTHVHREPVFNLIDIGSETRAEAIAAALGDRNATVREDAVDIIAELEDEAAIPMLEQALVDRDTAVREAAIAALAGIGGDQAARALATALNDESASLREDAVDALDEIGGETATRLLQQALVDEKDVIREAAAEILADEMAHR